MRKEQGITLIALVVTIVVLIILAGVSISMLTGENGIIKRAQDARENTRGGEVKALQTTDIITIGDEEVSIPGGATISKIPGEYEDVDKGIVIYIIPKEETPDWEADEDGDGILDVQEKYDHIR